MDNSWRASLSYDARQTVTKRILDVLVRDMPIEVAGQDSVNEVINTACRFEEKIFQDATDHPEYLQKISLKMLALVIEALQARDTPGAHAATTASQPQQVQQQLEQQWQQVLPQLKQHWQQEHQQWLQQEQEFQRQQNIQRQRQQNMLQQLCQEQQFHWQQELQKFKQQELQKIKQQKLQQLQQQQLQQLQQQQLQQLQQQQLQQLQQRQQWVQWQQHRSLLKLAEECMEAVGKMPSWHFNNEQCDYLVDKLNVVIQSASSFLEVSYAEDHPPYSSVDLARRVETFKLLLALANQVKSFVQDCCSDAWIKAAMTLTNVAEYVSFTGFNLQLCKVALCKERVGSETLTLDEVVNISNAEVEIVKEKASADLQTLLAKLRSLRSLRGGKRDSVNYILKRISRFQGNQDSLSTAKDEESFWKKLFACVKPAERLGRGSVATVHKAKWLGIQVAKKTFEGQRNINFMKEVGILGKLCHPNITSMFCSAKDNWCCSIIMELMDEDLHDLMRRRCKENINSPGPFPILEAVDIMLQIGEGVNYLYTQKIVHKDLKSFNILVKTVKESGSKVEYVHAKVADFGLSKKKESSIRYSAQTLNTGTSRWMAPEIINLNVGGQENTLGPKYPFKIDVYSFAMVCYEILTGYVPFHEEGVERIVKEKVVNGERPSLPQHCPPLLKALIEKCWIQEPEERPSFAMICSELKYLKYLLMTGVDGMFPTSGLAQDVGFVASSSCIGPAMKQTLGQYSLSQGHLEGQFQAQMKIQHMNVQLLSPHQMGAQQMGGQQLNPQRFLGNQEDECETLVASSSGNVTEQEERGRTEEGSGGVNFDGMVTPIKRTNSDREPFSKKDKDESQPKKSKRSIM